MHIEIWLPHIRDVLYKRTINHSLRLVWLCASKTINLICLVYRNCFVHCQFLLYCTVFLLSVQPHCILYAENSVIYINIVLYNSIERFHTIPRDTKDNRHSGHVGAPNKRNHKNSFVESTPTWQLWRQVKTLYCTYIKSQLNLFTC